MSDTHAPAQSFKQLKAEGQIKTKDIFRFPYELLATEPGFNPRDLSKPATQAKIQSIKESAKAGGYIPPLLIRVVNGKGIITDGECRYTAFGLAIAEGADIKYIDCLPDTGNDADRAYTAVTSAEGEGLTPLERALQYKRLVTRFGHDEDEIAARLGKTRSHVDQMLLLARGNEDVHKMIRDELVSAAVAVEAIRKHGENAGEYLASQLASAKKVGAKKVTASTIAGKPFPREVVSTVFSGLDEFKASLSDDAKKKIALAADAQGESATAMIEISAFDVFRLLESHDALVQEREKRAIKIRQAEEKQAQADIVSDLEGKEGQE